MPETPQGYQGPLPEYYVQSSTPQTPTLGLTISGVDPIVAYNFVLIDTFAAGGSGGSVSVNGVTVTSPNFNDTTPSAPSGYFQTRFQSSGSDVSAYGPAFQVNGNLTTSIFANLINLIDGDGIGISDTGSGAIQFTFTKTIPSTATGGAGLALASYDATTGFFTTIAVGSGTVTTFSAGTLSPLFTTSVANPTTAPALTFSLTNAAGGTVFGNATTGSAAPGYTTAPVLGIPGTSNGTIALASSTASGKFTIATPASSATPTLTLPTTSNVLAGQFAGDGVVYSASLVTASAAGTLTLPAPSSQSANVVFAGPTSGGAAQPTFRSLVVADIPNTTITPIWNNLQAATGALTLANTTFATTFTHTGATSATVPSWKWQNTTPTAAALTLSSVANASGGSTVYTGTITGGGSNAYAGATFTVAGFVTGANNGTFACTASSTTTLTLSNASGTSETHAATATGSLTASPAIVLSSQYYSGSASAEDTWTIQVTTDQTVANRREFLTFSQSGTSGQKALLIPAGGAATPNIVAQAGTTGFAITASACGATTSGAANWWSTSTTTGAMTFPSGAAFGFSSNSNPAAALPDTAFSRITAGTIGIGTGAVASIAGNLQLNTITSYGGTTTVGQGVASEIATVDLTAQTAAIAATNLTASAPRTGHYRISWSATITTAATTGAATSTLGGTNGFQVGFTSPTDSVAKLTVAGNSTTSAANTTGTAVGGNISIYAKTGTAITYRYDYASNTAAEMVYELHIRLEAL